MGSELLVWVVVVCCCFFSFSVGFTPVDQYLIDCGSLSNTIVSNNRVFVSDAFFSKLLSTPDNILVKDTNSNTVESTLYRTARVFTGVSKYTFPISHSGRHWIRLYFYPFSSGNYTLSSANFSVTAQNYLLLSDFTPPGATSVVKEFTVNVTGASNLEITFSPSNNSIAFLNALEVVSVPDTLVAETLGLYTQALETVARVNMGGPGVSSANDTLQRSWVPDEPFLLNKNLATKQSNIGSVKYPDGGATPDTAPATVYGTCIRMNSQDDPNANFNVSWEFDVDPGFQYFVRFHFCDIVSTVANSLYFNVYIDSYNVAPNVDPSPVTLGALATAFYMDFVTAVSDNSKIRISIGPSTIKNVYPDAILNGLEIMKMNNSKGSLSIY